MSGRPGTQGPSSDSSSVSLQVHVPTSLGAKSQDVHPSVCPSALQHNPSRPGPSCSPLLGAKAESPPESQGGNGKVGWGLSSPTGRSGKMKFLAGHLTLINSQPIPNQSPINSPPTRLLSSQHLVTGHGFTTTVTLSPCSKTSREHRTALSHLRAPHSTSALQLGPFSPTRSPGKSTKTQKTQH